MAVSTVLLNTQSAAGVCVVPARQVGALMRQQRQQHLHREQPDGEAQRHARTARRGKHADHDAQ